MKNQQATMGKLIATVGMAAYAMATVAASELPDIAGIRFGVPHKDAAAQVRSVNQALVVSEIKSR